MWSGESSWAAGEGLLRAIGSNWVLFLLSGGCVEIRGISCPSLPSRCGRGIFSGFTTRGLGLHPDGIST